MRYFKKFKSFFHNYSLDKLISLIEESIKYFSKNLVGGTNIFSSLVVTILLLLLRQLKKFLIFLKSLLKNIIKLIKNILRFFRNYLGMIFEEISIYWKYVNEVRESLQNEINDVIEYIKDDIDSLDQRLMNINDDDETIEVKQPQEVNWLILLVLLLFWILCCYISFCMTIWLIQYFYWLPFVHQKIRKFIVEWYDNQKQKELNAIKTSGISKPKRTKARNVSTPTNDFPYYESASEQTANHYKPNFSDELSNSSDDDKWITNNDIIQPVNSETSKKSENDDSGIDSTDLLPPKSSFPPIDDNNPPPD